MRKKIAILTLTGYFNFGNRLQNYATQEILKALNFDVETIPNKCKHICNKSNCKKIKSLKGRTVKEILDKMNYKVTKYIYKENDIQRVQLFKKFTADYITESEYVISPSNLPEDLSERYDYFITGSDQVWNPSNIYGSSIFFLTFASEKKRIAYAPSFGVSHIPDVYKEKYKAGLFGMHRLSIREEIGAKIIKQLTERDATVLIDPTLMLTKEKWLSISKESFSKPNRRYLLTYFLGTISIKKQKLIRRIAKENALEIVNLTDIKDPQKYIIGPSEFIDFVNSASILCTDSFHGTVFAILMQTPFIVFERNGFKTESMYSRIDTLLSTFKLESRKLPNLKSYKKIFTVDYSYIYSILEIERKKAVEYLKEALNVEEGI